MHSHTTWNWMHQFSLLTLCWFNLHGLGYSAAINPQLPEGSPCLLEKGLQEGVCVKPVDCPKKMMEIKAKNYTDEDRCGFWKFDEIVCCAKVHLARRSTTGSRADAACERYKETNIEPSSSVTVRPNPKESPHVAALIHPTTTEDVAGDEVDYICSGTLISEKHVITAAHCVSDIQDAISVEVVLGTRDLTKTRSELAVQRIPTAKIVKHPEYKRGFNHHDVAVIELKEPAKFTSAVHPTCLMTKPLSSPNIGRDTSLAFLGWGIIDINEPLPPHQLRKIENLQLVETTKCSESSEYAQGLLPNGLDDGMLCVGDLDAKRRSETCWGDSGGPILVESQDFPPLVGITSFGQECGGSTPGVYTSVYKYLDWIEDQLWPITD